MGQCNKMLEEMSFNALFQKLPVGIEVYDERGQLVDLNRTDENLFAISRKDIMGINLFENPNFPEDKIARLKQGEMVVFDCNYEFDNIQTNEYYNIDPKKEGTNLRLSIKCVPLKGEAHSCRHRPAQPACYQWQRTTRRGCGSRAAWSVCPERHHPYVYPRF